MLSRFIAFEHFLEQTLRKGIIGLGKKETTCCLVIILVLEQRNPHDEDTFTLTFSSNSVSLLSFSFHFFYWQTKRKFFFSFSFHFYIIILNNVDDELFQYIIKHRLHSNNSTIVFTHYCYQRKLFSNVTLL